MKNSTKWLLGALALVALIVVATVLYDTLGSSFEGDGLVTDVPNGNNTSAAPDGSDASDTSDTVDASKYAAPDFTVTDAEGNKVKLSDLRGKPVVINFWATWCGYCVQEMPAFEDMYAKYGDDVHFVMVDMVDGDRETVDAGKKFIADRGFTFPVYFDTELEAAYAYYVTGLPATYFIDAEGNLIAHKSGALDAELLERGINMILK